MQKYLLLGALALITITTVGLYNYKHIIQGENISLENSATNQKCPDLKYRSKESFQNLQFNILYEDQYHQRTEEGMIRVIEDDIGNEPTVLSGAQAEILMGYSDNLDGKLRIFYAIDKYISYLSLLEFVAITQDIFIFESDIRFTLFKAMANTLLDLEEAQKNIQEYFYLPDDKQEAQKILDNAKPRNCIFGSDTKNVTYFIIDVSNSMNQLISTGETRLNFVKQNLLQTIFDQLEYNQYFNILALSEDCDEWKSQSVAATEENKTSALNYIFDLQTKNSINISQCLEKAFQTQEQIESIYLLTNGAPNKGIQYVTEMEYFVNELIYQYQSPAVQINTISLMGGGNESPAEKQIAQEFQEVIAHAGKGFFKPFN